MTKSDDAGGKQGKFVDLKASGSVRRKTTISVPPELKDQMDAVEEPVNWSAVASHCFQLKLGELAEQKKQKDAEAVAQRLRASRLRSTDNWYKRGFPLGRQWAENRADADGLGRLAGFMRSPKVDAFFTDRSMEPSELAEILYSEAIAEIDPDERWGDSKSADDEIEVCWATEACGESEHGWKVSKDFLRGFVDGAVGVWNEVKDLL